MSSVISVEQILLSFIPFVIGISLLAYYSINLKELLYASVRMVLQLVGIGYVLTYLFAKDHFLWTSLLLTIMIVVSSWVSLRVVKKERLKLLKYSFLALLFGSTPVLFWTTGLVIPGESIWDPRFVIPLAGMVYANSMNTLSLAAERLLNELKIHPWPMAQSLALKAAFIPHINTFLVVGLVSLPGMMTGQILSGVDPLIAVRYQIVIMTMIFSSSALSSLLFVKLLGSNLD